MSISWNDVISQYMSLPDNAKSVYRDIIDAFVRQIQSRTHLKCINKTPELIEGNDIVFLVYKNDLICSEETKKFFTISDKFHLGTISFFRMEIIENLEKLRIVQRLTIKNNNIADLDEKLLDEATEKFISLDESTGRYKFKSAIKFVDEGILLGDKRILTSDLTEAEKTFLNFYKKFFSAYGETEITDILNLDDSYFIHDYLLTSLDNLLILSEYLRSENLDKPLIGDYSIENNQLLINSKEFRMASKKKRFVKSIEFFDLLLRYFSRSTLDKVSLTELVEFVQNNKISYSQLEAGDVGNTRRVNSYLDSIKQALFEKYQGETIFTKKSTIIYLKKARIIK